MRSVLITGGTGSLGHALTRRLLADGVERLCILSRDEVKQGDMRDQFAADAARLRFFLGDVRDRGRLIDAFHGVDVVVHAAALKRVDATSYAPDELIKTNVLGTVNVVGAAVEAGVPRVLLISSDKAVAPTNPYGASKQMAEAHAVASNSLTVPRGTRVSVLRYGNVLGSRGSAVEVWRGQQARGEPLTLTDPAMTRFVLTLGQAALFVREALDMMQGGEVFVPVLPACSIDDLRLALCLREDWSSAYPTCVTGLRPGGEKLHESLLNRDEAQRTVVASDTLWAVNPHLHSWRSDAPWQGEPFPVDAVYNSETCGWRLGVDELRKLLDEECVV